MNQELDLSALSRDRGRSTAVASRRPRRWLTRYVIPAGLLVGFLALLGFAAGDTWRSRTPVTVVPVIVQQNVQQAARAPLFQAAGWIEPRPSAVNVPALATGVIAELLVVEGESVTADQPVARLIEADAVLAVRRAQAMLEIREGELERAIAERDAARIRLDQPLHLDAALADAENALAVAQNALNQLPLQIQAARTELTFARQSLTGKQRAGESVAAISRFRAQADLAAREAELDQLLKRQPHLEQQVAALIDKRDAVRKQRAQRVDEQREWKAAEARIKTAQAARDQAQVELESAELDLERMVVRAPIAGRVLKRVSVPGDYVAGMSAPGEQHGAGVVQLYNPERLQVRADVRLEDVPRVIPGQSVIVDSDASSEPMEGRVLLPTSAANIQKNTLEVKIALLDPPPSVTPEMLARVTFLAPDLDSEPPTTERREQMLVPGNLIQSSDAGTYVWVVDHQNQAQRIPIETGAQAEGDLVVVTSGLNPTNKLIATGMENLASGSSVRIVGEATTPKTDGSLQNVTNNAK